ncbi:copper chaperone for superoxide dismutase isoform X2 [Pseudophryne corroboree]|uniref:copper chaperone for superoxide dismutase isoform X2 n=1 Tax=Pseudophryne corroboree TaxID=495146 RepID=UPI0030818160
MELPAGHGVSCKLEFAVQMTCEKCVNAVKSSLQGVKGVQDVTVSLESESVIVKTTLPALEVQSLLESTGRRAVLKGMGNNAAQNLGAAVVIMSGEGKVQGVVRFLQVSENTCVIDGSIDGLSPGLHGLHIHEFGDLSGGYESCGAHFNPDGNTHGGPGDHDRHVGDLGNIFAGDDGRAVFRITNVRVKVWNVIGRSLMVDKGEDDLGCGSHPCSKVTGNSGKGLAFGIIARSAGLFENTKKICACDGVTIWEERDYPIAGPGRKNLQTTASAADKIAKGPAAEKVAKGPAPLVLCHSGTQRHKQHPWTNSSAAGICGPASSWVPTLTVGGRRQPSRSHSRRTLERKAQPSPNPAGGSQASQPLGP